MRDPGKPVRPTRRPGEVRRIVEALLEQASAPMSAYDLCSMSANAQERLYVPQVYRALNELIAEGKALRIETLNAFFKRRPGRNAVGICAGCGQVQQIDMGELHAALTQLFEQQDFASDRLIVEVNGRCFRCRSSTDDHKMDAARPDPA